LVKLKEFYEQEKDMIKKTKKKSFLSEYSKGELNLFEDYFEKMISSKAAEIYK
jgi:hypothetical protein